MVSCFSYINSKCENFGPMRRHVFRSLELNMNPRTQRESLSRVTSKLINVPVRCIHEITDATKVTKQHSNKAESMLPIDFYGYL